MKFKSFILYALYGVITFIIFLIILFPKERAANILSEKINSQFLHGEVFIESLSLIFPLNIKAVNTLIRFNDGNEIKIESIYLYPEILSFYKDIKKIEIKAESYAGEINGIVGLGKLSSFYDLSLAVNFKDLKIKNLKFTVENFDIFSSFTVNGKLNYKTAENRDNEYGNGIFELSECYLKSDNIFLKQIGIEKLSFTNIDILWDKKEKIVNITNLNAKGPDMKIKLSGNILLKNPIDRSELDLKGDFEPASASITSYISGLNSGFASSLTKMLFNSKKDGSKKSSISFKISGNLNKPKIKI